MATDIEIASNALLLIGDEPISSFTEPGAGATAAANLYADTYLYVLSEHPWTFALKEQKLNLLSQTPDPLTMYSYAWQLPTDIVRLWSIFPWSQYDLIGDKLYSNINTDLLARYVFKQEETMLPGHFVKALEYKLASEFAVTVTESMSMSETMLGKYQQAVARAKNIDSQGKPQVPMISSPFIDVRLSGRSDRWG